MQRTEQLRCVIVDVDSIGRSYHVCLVIGQVLWPMCSNRVSVHIVIIIVFNVISIVNVVSVVIEIVIIVTIITVVIAITRLSYIQPIFINTAGTINIIIVFVGIFVGHPHSLAPSSTPHAPLPPPPAPAPAPATATSSFSSTVVTCGRK